MFEKASLKQAIFALAGNRLSSVNTLCDRSVSWSIVDRCMQNWCIL